MTRGWESSHMQANPSCLRFWRCDAHVPGLARHPQAVEKHVDFLLCCFLGGRPCTFKNLSLRQVNYNDLTRPNSPQMVVYVGNNPPSTASFRLVKYGCGSKIGAQNRTLVNETKDSNLRSTSWWLNFDPHPYYKSPRIYAMSPAENRCRRLGDRQ